MKILKLERNFPHIFCYVGAYKYTILCASRVAFYLVYLYSRERKSMFTMRRDYHVYAVGISTSTIIGHRFSLVFVL